MMQKIFLLLFFSHSLNAQTILFNTGFEGTTAIVTKKLNRNNVRGEDNTAAEPNSWDTDIPNYDANLGEFWIQYGHKTDRKGNVHGNMFADIVNDPEDTNNQVLHFQINEHNGHVGRVSSNIYHDGGYLFGEPNYKSGLKNFHYSVRIYIPEDFDWMLTEDQLGNEFNFMTLAEFFNIENFDYTGKSFRISLNLHKNTGEQQFRLSLKGEPGKLGPDNEIYWLTEDWGPFFSSQAIGAVGDSAADFQLNCWLNLDITFAEGDEKHGKLIMKINNIAVFDITANTHHKEDQRLDGIHHFSPMKLYTRDPVVDGFNKAGKTLQVYWDDFSLYRMD